MGVKLRGRGKIAYKWIDKKVGNLLDIGCASGYFTVYFKNKAKKVYGVDVKNEMIDEAKKLYPEIKFFVIKSEKLPFNSNMFDVVTILDVLEHVKDDKKMITEIDRILKKDGLLIMSVPHKGLFTFLEPDYIKTSIPSVYKLFYFLIKRRKPQINSYIHKHYSLMEINKLTKNKFEIINLHIGGSILSTILSYIEILFLRLFNRNYLYNLLTPIKNFDYSINYGKFGDNLIIKAKKI